MTRWWGYTASVLSVSLYNGSLGQSPQRAPVSDNSDFLDRRSRVKTLEAGKDFAL